MSDGRFPSSPPPPPVTPIVTGGRPWWQTWWVITAAAVVLIVGAAALIAGGTSGRDDDTAEPEPPATDAPPDGDDMATTEPPAGSDDPASTPAPDATVADGPVDTATAGTTDASPSTEVPPPPPPASGVENPAAPAGRRGDRASPVPLGEIADIGRGWRLQVLNVVEDGTRLVLDENQFNEPPLDGTRFTLVEIALGYYGLDDPANAFVPSISGVASASVELDEGCGVIPDDFPAFVDVFSGGVLTGNLCFVTTPSDAGTVQLYATTSFDGPDVFVDASAAPAAVMVMPTLRGPQPGATATPLRLDPTPIDTAVDVGEGWTVSVTAPAEDITDEVAAENQFNDPPPEGFRFVGVAVDLRYDGPGIANAFQVNAKMVGDSNVELEPGCGVVPGGADLFGDVLTGGVVSGTLCFVTPVPDVDTVVLYATTAFDAEPVMFATR